MKSFSKWMAGAGLAGTLLATAVPAQAQYYPDPRDRDTVDRVVGAVGAVAGAVLGVTRGGYYDPYRRGGYGTGYGYGYNRDFEQHAVSACNYHANSVYARRYGTPNLRVVTVQWVDRDRMRVAGTVALNDARYYRDQRLLSFSCDVRSDGRVVDFDDREYDQAYYRDNYYRRW